MKGYTGKILEVNLSKMSTKDIRLDDSVLRKYVGGRGLAARILWDRLGEDWENVSPLSEENLLLVFTGPLTGYYPGGRICISGKSPQSNGIVGSTVAGEFGIELKCAGYDGLILSGKADDPTYLTIKDEEIMFNNADSIWGESTRKTIREITKETRDNFREKNPNYGKWKEPAIIYIGLAGEKEVRMASVMAKITHAAGYGGYGAVMGSKNLKAIAVKGTAPLPEVGNWSRVKELISKVDEECYSNQRFRRWGTGAGGYTVGAKSSSEPVKNWQEEWHNKKEFGIDEFEKLWVKRFWADFGCPLSCMKLGQVKTSPYRGSISDLPDYELQAYMGTNLNVFSPEDNMHLSAIVDDYGICGIQGGNILGFVAELYQRGILTKEDLDGIKLEWGNTDAFEKLLTKIAEREGIGDLLAEGTYRAAQELSRRKGEDLMKYTIQSKGIAIGAHGIRSGQDYTTPISYVCSTQGGDHTSVASLEGREDRSILTDSLVICNFVTYSSSEEHIWNFINAVTGWEIDSADWKKKALRILNIQRAALLIGGPDLNWEGKDSNPPRFYNPLPSGPYKGKKAEKEEVKEIKQQYYENVGWNSQGVPTSQTLRDLGLNQIERKIKVLRKKSE